MRELKGMLSAKYDFVCGIGCDCGCAWHLIKKRLRLASYPLDWIGVWKIGLVGVAKLVANDFEGFLKLEDLRKEPNPPRGPQDDHEHDYYHAVGAVAVDFAHDFPTGVPLEEAFPAVRDKFRRRIDRLYRTIRASRRVLLVYWTWRDHPEPAAALEAAEIFRGKFPDVRIDLLVMRHADATGIRSEAPGDGVFIVDGPFHPVGGHPAFGEVEANRRVFSCIRLRGNRRRRLRRRLHRAWWRLLSLFIFNLAKRRAFRDRHSNPGQVA